MGTIIYNPVAKVSMGSMQLEVINGVQHGIEVVGQDTSWIAKLAEEIGKEVQKAFSQAIQENIVIPLKTFFIDMWIITVEISKWGSVFGIIVGGVIYVLGDQTKGKKVMVWSVIAQIIVQILNFIFLG